MNPIIKAYFDSIEVRLIQSHVIDNYQVVRQDITPSDGKLRIRCFLADGVILELFEYVAEYDKQIRLLKYSFHWQDNDNQLKKRWIMHLTILICPIFLIMFTIKTEQ